MPTARRAKRNTQNDDQDIEEEVSYNHEEEEQDDDDDDENERSRRNTNTTKPRRSKRTKVMSESNQTDADRRALRHNQRELHKKMTNQSTDLAERMADVQSDAFEKIRGENNKLWNLVRYTREAVLDGDNVNVISSRAARQVDKLISVPRYDANRLANKMKAKCSIRSGSNSYNTFDWKTFGIEAGSCFNSVPSLCSFLNGPIDNAYQPKQRKKPVRRIIEDDDAEEEEVGTVQQKSKSKSEDKLSAVEKQITVIRKTLKMRDPQEREKVQEKTVEHLGKTMEELDDVERVNYMKRVQKCAAHKPCMLQFVMNPDSFTQTIENIFGLSFLVKKGDAQCGVRTLEQCRKANLGTLPGPWVQLAKENQKQQPSAKQTIVSLNMQDWRALRDSYNVQTGDIPHRGKSKHAARPTAK